MEKIEMVEKLQQKANVSLEEAKAVLERCDWDLLDAMILLEKEGKVRASASAARASSVREEPAYVEAAYTETGSKSGCKSDCCGDKAGNTDSGWKRFCAFMKKLLRKGMDNRFVVRRNGSVIVDLPVLVSVVLMIVFFWLTIILLVVGLFTRCEYSFEGADLGKENINNGFRKASDAAQTIADQFKSKEN